MNRGFGDSIAFADREKAFAHGEKKVETGESSRVPKTQGEEKVQGTVRKSTKESLFFSWRRDRGTERKNTINLLSFMVDILTVTQFWKKKWIQDDGLCLM